MHRVRIVIRTIVICCFVAVAAVAATRICLGINQEGLYGHLELNGTLEAVLDFAEPPAS